MRDGELEEQSVKLHGVSDRAVLGSNPERKTQRSWARRAVCSHGERIVRTKIIFVGIIHFFPGADANAEESTCYGGGGAKQIGAFQSVNNRAISSGTHALDVPVVWVAFNAVGFFNMRKKLIEEKILHL